MTADNEIEKKLEDLGADLASDDSIAETVMARIDNAKIEKSNKPILIRRFTMKNRITKIAAAAVIVIGVLLPLAYGATKIVKHFLIDGIKIVVKDSDKINTEQDAKNAIKEFSKLYREGKAKEVKPGVWVVTLSNGEEFAYSGNNPEWAGLSNDEIQKLREGQSLKKDTNKQ